MLRVIITAKLSTSLMAKLKVSLRANLRTSLKTMMPFKTIGAQGILIS